MIWTQEQDNLLRELKPKHTAAEIASAIQKKFRVQVSRNSVIGRLHRLDLKSPAKAKTPRREAKPIRKRADTAAATLAKKIKALAYEPKIKAEKFKPRSVTIKSKRKFIIDLGPLECRWPDEKRDVKTGKHTFCGQPTHEGASYCPDHAALSYSKGTRSEQSAVNAAKSIARAA